MLLLVHRKTVSGDTDEIDRVARVQIVDRVAGAGFLFHQHFQIRIFGRTREGEICGSVTCHAQHRDLTGYEVDALAIDALHMMAFVDTEPGAQLAWDTKALAHMEGSDQPDAKKWEASLRNNVGYARHLLGEYDEALRQFRLSLAAHERAGRARAVRIDHWMIAWTLRAQRKFDEAIAIQLRLEREWQEANEPDPYVFEELEHLYRATGDTAQAEAYAQKLRAARK